MRSDLLSLRFTLIGICALQLGVLWLMPTDVIASYPKAYARWLPYGSDPDWAWRVGVVFTASLLTLLRAHWVIGFSGMFALGVMFTCEGLLFATTHPPQTGVAYFSPAIAAFWLAYRDAKP